MHEVTRIKKADGTSKPQPIVAFKGIVSMVAAQADNGPPIEGAVSVSIIFVLPRPKTMMWKRRPMPRVRHIIKLDRDNLDKAVLDAIGKRLWKGDCQVCAGTNEKWIAAGDEQPHVTIVIEELE